MVVGRITMDPVRRLMSYQAFAGFAADGVKRIAVVAVQDRVIPVTAVVDSTFFSPDPPEEFKRLAALDAAGEIIWRGDEAPLPDE